MFVNNEKGRSVARCPRPCFYKPNFVTKLLQLNLETIKSLSEIDSNGALPLVPHDSSNDE